MILTVGTKEISIEREDDDFPVGNKENFLYIHTPQLVLIKIAHNIEHNSPPPDFELIDDMLNHADELMYPSNGEEDDFCRRYNALTDAIAFLALVPCGVCMFGYRYEVRECQQPNLV